jgi:hypothetical protein
MPAGATKDEQPQRGKHPRSALFSDALRASNRYVTAKAVTHKAWNLRKNGARHGYPNGT